MNPVARKSFGPLSSQLRSRASLDLAIAWLPVSCLFLLALLLYLHALGSPSLWFDEAFSVELARQPLPRLWQAIWGPEPNMELYYLLLHFWLQLTGALGLAPTEFIVRLPSAICAALSVVVVYLFGKRYLSVTAGLCAALLYLLNYSTLIYAQQTRAYALQLLLLTLSWYALAACYTARRRLAGWWTLYVVTTTLAFYAQLFSLVIFFIQLVTIAGLWLLPTAWREDARQRWKLIASALVAIGLLALPLIPVARQTGKTDWLAQPHFHDLLNLLAVMLGGDHPLVTLLVLSCLPALLLIPLALILRRAERQGLAFSVQHGNRWLAYARHLAADHLPLLWLISCWFIVTILLSFGLSLGPARLFSSRYLVVTMPAFALLSALGLSLVRPRLLQGALALLLVALSFVNALNYYPHAQLEDRRSAAMWLQHHYQPNDGLVCYNTIQGCQVSFEYYFAAYPISQAHFTNDAPGNLLSWQTDSGYAAPGRTPDAALDINAVAAYARQHPRLFYIVGRVPDSQAAQQVSAVESWLDHHYRLLASMSSAGDISVRLYAVAPEISSERSPATASSRLSTLVPTAPPTAT
ncbi:glycosyltransferase family 39 protein [Thermogemmatispora onikobensis]|uniref:glycosyltransferase family 39 protein n=1 Tax=Thermogemmatispora onikobensis TaxID=732234 RepID=UPI00085369E7|nr:glycosyltransferase family 39 protein [Thermogemmatispora onikobensis]